MEGDGEVLLSLAALKRKSTVLRNGIETSLVCQAFIALFSGSGAAFIIDLGSLLQAKLVITPSGSFVCSFAGESHKFHYDLEPGDKIRMTLDGQPVYTVLMAVSPTMYLAVFTLSL